METKVKQTPATNTNPVLSVDKNGTVLYSNEAGNLLLNKWGIEIGEKLPPSIGDLVQKVISGNSPEKMEVKVGNRVYLVVFSPLPEQECVNISGFEISDQINLEQKLRESEEDLAEAQNMAHIGNWKWNIITGELFWSDEVFRIFGLNPQEFEATFDTYFHYVHPDDRNYLNNAIKKAFKGEPYSVDNRILTANGEERIVHTEAEIIFNEDNNPVYARGTVQDITERKLAEEALRESMERFRSVLENSLDSAYRLDLKNNYFDYMSPVIEHITGFSPEEMNVIGRNGLLDRIHPEDRPQVIAEIAKALDEGFGTHEYRFKCKDGKYHWLADHFSFIKDKTGMTRFRAGIVRNITEQKRVEEALAASEKEYRELFNSMTEMFQVLELVYDENGQAVDFYYREVNPATEKLTGKSRDEMVGKQARELFGVVEEYWIQALDLVNKSGEPLHFENYSKELDKYYDLNAFKVADRANTVAIVFSDITERRKAEEDLKNLNETLETRVQERTTELHEAYILLKESEKSLSESQEIAHIGSWDCYIETNKVRWSDETYHIFGLNPQELEASFGLFFSYVHPDDRESIENEVKEALKGKTYSIDYRIILPSGERTVHSYGKIIFDENNVPIRMKGTTQDITERKRAEEALYKSEMRLRRFYESGIVGVFYYKMDGLITEANNKFLEMIGYTRDDLQAGRIKWDKMTPPEYRPLEEYALAELKATGMATPYEKEYTRKDGSRIPIILGVANIEGPRDDGIAFVLDATERKKAEESLAKIEIARKQEIYHRIKNNLQVISSLLDLQAEKFRGKKKIEDLQVLEAFKESQDRVISMALIHEELHKGGKLDTLNFSHYIEELADNLLLTYRLGNDCIILDIDIEEDIFFDMDTAVPLGIIINELVSNSLKHAFPNRDKGKIQIKLHRQENGESKSEDCNLAYILTVSDNGIGIPEDLDIEDLDSLGLQLVTSLVDQLDGEFELKSNNGTEFTMRFAVKENSSSVSVAVPELIE